MIETWFTSDTHFYHENILKYESDARPFATVEEMNETLIERWNSRVKPKDNVYHLGDFCFGGVQNVSIAARLNGSKRLVLGNHDKYAIEEYAKYFDKIFGVTFWNKCILSHVPVHISQMQGEKRRCLVNLHGHLHSKTLIDAVYYNVSVERNLLYPINADIINRHVDALMVKCEVTYNES